MFSTMNGSLHGVKARLIARRVRDGLMCCGVCPSDLFMRAFSPDREIREVRP